MNFRTLARYVVALFSLFGCATNSTHVARAVGREENRRPAAHPSDKFCGVVKDWLSGEFTPQQLCQKHNGEYCESIAAFGPALCAASGKTLCTEVKSVGQGICVGSEGALCDGIKNTAAGYCSALREPACASAQDEKHFKEKFEVACGW